jgi:hypothetical protein
MTRTLIIRGFEATLEITQITDRLNQSLQKLQAQFNYLKLQLVPLETEGLICAPIDR